MKPFLFMLISLLIFTACEKDPDEKKAPEIPPVETFYIDFGEMANTNKSAESGKTNWIYSATTIGAWNIITWSKLAIPVAAFKSAINQTPEVIDDVTWTWQWTYTIEGFNNEYTARLIGKLETASGVKWQMYVSKNGEDNSFEDFLWFEGTSDTDGKSGNWIVYHSPGYNERIILIDWTKESEEIGEITYSYVRKLNDLRLPDEFNGSTLTYGLQDSELDAYVHFHTYNAQKDAFVDTEIEWNRSDYSGHIKAEHFFNDTDWHCWDADGNDVDCN